MLLDSTAHSRMNSNMEDLASISEVPTVPVPSQKDTRKSEPTGPTNGNIPPPKTDKPRPHVCTTCGRSFARLEHLKRHERSHTKEKPFECPDCARCFARRDLLLRHQQKLHMTTTPSSRPRNGRRESTGNAGVANGSSGANRVRKNSIAGNSSSTARPRANTISHIDQAALGIVGTTAPSPAAPHHHHHSAHAYHPSLSSSMGSHPMDYRGFGSAGQQQQHHHLQQQQQQQQQHPSHLNGLTKLETAGLPIDFSGGLRTAPVYGSFDTSFSDMLMGHGSTINPAQLHFGGSPQGLAGDDSSSPFTPGAAAAHQIPQQQQQQPPTDPMMDDEFSFDWMMNGLDPSLPLGNGTDSAVDESSPSAMSTGSQSGISEAMMDGPHRLSLSSSGWHNPFTTHASAPSTHPFAFDYPVLNDFGIPPDTVSPKSLMAQQQNNPFSETYATPPSMTSVGQPMLGGHSQSMFPSSMATNGESPNPLNLPFANSTLRNSHSSASSTNSFTDSTRQALLASMGRPSGFNHRKYSPQSTTTATPTTPTTTTTTAASLQGRDHLLSRSSAAATAASSTGFNSTGQLPSTSDMQRYISSYIVYFHPHAPFLHIPTLNFQAPEYTNNLRTSNGKLNMSNPGISGGGGCLILSMAALGALYEFDTAASKDLFEAAKKMIQLYLEERRKADMSAALNRSNPSRENSVHNTPLWLVQAMLLNVIYGHTCGDKTSAEIASTHCAALVSLARAAELTHHLDPEHLPQDHLNPGPSERDTEGGVSKFGPPKERKEWLDWKIVEERKRTLYAIFVLSSFAVSAYNHAPALTNSEVQLDLPCEEDLWAAESPQAWKQLGGHLSSKKSQLTFSFALTTLLTTSQREQPLSSSLHFVPNASLVGDVPSSDLKPSTFGCLVLIYALHNYIWETRQRHLGRQWTSRETDAMQAHIEPALRAWQAAWASNPLHSLERPNPYGAGPLSADAVPLLDLAYIRLFVNLGRCKEAFWHRDWNAISVELARGAALLDTVDEITPDVLDPSITNGDGGMGGAGNHAHRDSVTDLGVGDLSISMTPTGTQDQSMQTLAGVYRPGQTRQEKLLRKAAFYAADSISMSNRLGNTYNEFTSRELPIQCAMCIFDCSLVLSEWIASVQERVGPYMGILGRDENDSTQMPGILLLEDEDCKLIDKIKEILSTFEIRIQQKFQNNTTVSAISALQRLPSVVDGGYGSQILMAASTLLDRAGVWPVTKLMARSLESQAMRLKERAEASAMRMT